MEPENTPLGKGGTSTNHELLGSIVIFSGCTKNKNNKKTQK